MEKKPRDYEKEMIAIIKDIDGYKEKAGYDKNKISKLKDDLTKEENKLEQYKELAHKANNLEVSFAEYLIKTGDNVRELKDEISKREKVEKEFKEKKENLNKYTMKLENKKETVKNQITEYTDKVSLLNEEIKELKEKETKSEKEINKLNELISEREKIKAERKDLREELGRINKALKVVEEYREELVEENEPDPAPKPGPATAPKPGPATAPKPGPAPAPKPGPATAPKPGPATGPTPNPKNPDPIIIKFDSKTQTYKAYSSEENVKADIALLEMSLADFEKEEFKEYKKEVKESLMSKVDVKDLEKPDYKVAFMLKEANKEFAGARLNDYFSAAIGKKSLGNNIKIIYNMNKIYSRQYEENESDKWMDLANLQEQLGIATVKKNRFTRFLEKHNGIRHAMFKIRNIGKSIKSLGAGIIKDENGEFRVNASNSESEISPNKKFSQELDPSRYSNDNSSRETSEPSKEDGVKDTDDYTL